MVLRKYFEFINNMIEDIFKLWNNFSIETSLKTKRNMKPDLNTGIYCWREESIHFQLYELGFAELSHLLPYHLHLQGDYFTKHKKRKDISCLRWILIFCKYVLNMSLIWCLGAITFCVSERTQYNRLSLSLFLPFALLVTVTQSENICPQMSTSSCCSPALVEMIECGAG